MSKKFFITIIICAMTAIHVSAQANIDIANLRTEAQAGNVKAQVRLANCLLSGQGVAVNHSEAVKWYSMAAEKGNTEAQFNLAYCYENGIGIPKDWDQAVKWYTKAAYKGNA